MVWQERPAGNVDDGTSLIFFGLAGVDLPAMLLVFASSFFLSDARVSGVDPEPVKRRTQLASTEFPYRST